jgi:hypothetical protein
VGDLARIEEAAAELSAQGRLDSALFLLEQAPECPERSVGAARARLAQDLVAGPVDGDAVRAAWTAWLTGDRVAAQRTFSRVLRAHVASGTAPRPFAPKPSELATQVAPTTFASQVLDAVTDARGALVYDVTRAPGGAATAPFRFLPGGLARGPQGLVVTGDPTLHVSGPGARAARLPASDAGAIVDGGRIAVLRVDGSLAAFDLPSGAARAMPRLPLPDLREGVPVTDLGDVVLCSSMSRSAFAWSPATPRLVKSEDASACAYDEHRGLLATLHGRPRARSPVPSYDMELQVRSLSKPGVVRASLGVLPERDFSRLAFDARTGLLEVVLADLPTKIARWIDPATGHPGDPVAARRRSRGLMALPVREARDLADFRPLDALARPGRWLLPPMPPGPNMNAGWTENGVRTEDGRIVAVMDAKQSPSPDDGPLGGDHHLVLAHTDPLKAFADVPMRTTKWGPWHTLRILGERYAAARWGWTYTVVDLARGELRATVDSEAAGGNLSLLPGDFLVSGPDVYDLGAVRAVDRGTESRIDPGFLPADVELTRRDGTTSFATRKQPELLRASSAGYEAAAGAPPRWLHCLVGEWVLPIEACAHRLTTAR